MVGWGVRGVGKAPTSAPQAEKPWAQEPFYCIFESLLSGCHAGQAQYYGEMTPVWCGIWLHVHIANVTKLTGLSPAVSEVVPGASKMLEQVLSVP